YVQGRQQQQDVLLVGGQGGVSRLFNPKAAGTSLPALWTRFGAGLPNAPVFDLHLDVDYGARTGGNFVLIAGTLGRGAWTISGESIESLLQPSRLQILGAAQADTFTLSVNPANPLL